MNSLSALKVIGRIALVVLLCVAGGCKKSTGPAGDGAAPGANAANELEGRLKAALAIFDTSKKDAALHAVADAAGAAGDSRVVKVAVGSIFNTSVKDAAADSAAVALAKAGQRTEAAEVARMIFNTAQRDATLSKLAKD
jgi:predicted metal-dependent HD superfamily phosphohydrolase